MDPTFHKLRITENIVGSQTIFSIYNNCLKDIPYKLVVPNPFETANQPTLDNFTAARE